MICYGRVALTTRNRSQMLANDRALGVMKSLYLRALAVLPQIKEGLTSQGRPEDHIAFFYDLKHIDFDKTLNMLKEEIKGAEDSLKELAKNKASVFLYNSVRPTPNARRLYCISSQSCLTMDLLREFPYAQVKNLLETLVNMGSAISEFSAVAGEIHLAGHYRGIVNYLSYYEIFEEATKFAKLLKPYEARHGHYSWAQSLIIARRINCDPDRAVEIIKENPLFVIASSRNDHKNILRVLPKLKPEVRTSICAIFKSHSKSDYYFFPKFNKLSSEIDLDLNSIENKNGGKQFRLYSKVEQKFRINGQIDKAEEISKRMLAVNFSVQDLSEWKCDLEEFFSFFIEKDHEKKVEEILALKSGVNEKINAFISCAKAYQKNKKPEKAIHYLKQARKLIDQNDLDPEPNPARYIFVGAHQMQYDSPEAKKLYNLILLARVAKVYSRLDPNEAQKLVKELEKQSDELGYFTSITKLVIAELLMIFDPVRVLTYYNQDYDLVQLSSILKLCHPLQPESDTYF